MARGKLPAADEFHDGGYRFRRLKRGEKGKAFSVLVRMPADDEHATWWWSKPRKVTLTNTNDKTELLQLADAYRVELMSDATAPVTVSAYVGRWLERRSALVDRGNIKQSTVDRERTTLQHVTDYIGDVVLSNVTTAAVSDMDTRMARDGVSMSTRARAHVKLRQMLGQAVRDGLIDENPAESVAPDDVPHVPQRDATRYEERRVTIPEADKLMLEIMTEPRDGLHAAVWLAYTMGLRRGEALGLRWSDIDESTMTMRIDRQMTRQGVTSPKTYKSARSLPISSPILRYMQEWKAQQQLLYSEPLPIRDKRGRVTGQREMKWSPSTYICSNADGGEWRPNGNFNRGLRHFFISHGLGEWIVGDDGKKHYHGATLHSLRHTHATVLVRDGVDVRSAQALLGHASPITTMRIYTDDDEQAKRDASMTFAQHIATERDMGLYDADDFAAYEAFIEESE